VKAAASIRLIEPEGLYRQVFERILADTPYRLNVVDADAPDAELIACDEDILFISLELPGGQSLDLVRAIRGRRPEIPVVFFTNHDVNRYLQELESLPQSNVLAKPFTREELLFFLDKLVHPERAFGLANYLKPGARVVASAVTRSDEVRREAETLLARAGEWGFRFDYDFKIDLVIHELLVNALYHAHGFEEEKVGGKPVVLPPGDRVETECGHDDNRFGITITDYCGRLSRKRIFAALQSLERQQQEAAAGGIAFQQHGRGIDIVRKNSGEYYFVIERGVRTQAVIIFDRVFEKDDEFTSLRIFEYGADNPTG
jgi:CheY-like chemotaxis protein